MEYVVKTSEIVKLYGNKAAVNKACVNIKKGEIYGLIGKNGAGKTTLMKMLLGLTSPTSGSISLFDGMKLSEARQKIGSLIEEPALYKNETAFENMKRFAILSSSTEEEIHSLLKLVGLAYTGKLKVKGFSLGMKQRLGIAIALLGHPELLILDEPLNGLDPEGIKGMRNIILQLNRQGVSFIISSHLLDELSKIATSYGILADGVLVEEITALELEDKCRKSLKITTDNSETALKVIEGLGIGAASEDESAVRMLSQVEDASVIVEALVKNGVRVYEVVNDGQSHEDYFLERMG